jgi:hypothetical protein
MIKFVTTAAVLGVLSTGVFASPASARVAAPHDMVAGCWQQVHRVMPGYGTDAGADRKREFLLEACIQNNGQMP